MPKWRSVKCSTLAASKQKLQSTVNFLQKMHELEITNMTGHIPAELRKKLEERSKKKQINLKFKFSDWRIVRF